MYALKKVLVLLIVEPDVEPRHRRQGGIARRHEG